MSDVAARRALESQVTTSLYATAKREASGLSAYLRERDQNVATLARLPDTVAALDEFGRASADAAQPPTPLDTADRQHRPFLTSYQEAFGYDELALLLPDGRVVFTTRGPAAAGASAKAETGGDAAMRAAFTSTRRLLELNVSDFAPSDDGQVAAYVGAPVLDHDRLLGVVLVRLGAKEIFTILADYTGLGATGETLLIRRIDDSATDTVVSAAPFSRRIAFGSANGLPEQHSVSGSGGHGETTDYDNRRVLAVWRYVPLLGAGLVVKIDTDEAYSPIRWLAWLALAMVATTLLLVIGAARSLARSIAGPVVALTEATSHIAEGDLTRRVDIKATNEIGLLAGSFNCMTERLAQSIEELRTTTAAKERIESELRVAHDIQMGILPKIFPPFPHRPEFDVHAMLQPAKQVGGDFYDFQLFDDQELYVIIGDVSGKGVPASLFMAVTLTLFRSSVSRGMSPAALLTKLNDDLCTGNTSSLFVTVFCARLDVRTGTVAFANGGHNPPYRVTAAGAASPLPLLGGPVLGILEQHAFDEGTVHLEPGDRLVLFTDGITEASTARDELYGDPRLMAILEAGSHDGATFDRDRDRRRRPAVRLWRAAGGRSNASRAPLPGRHPERPVVNPEVLSVTCRNRLEEIAGVIERIEAFGSRHGLTAEERFTLTLALDEVVTNIVSYAYDDAHEHQIVIRLDIGDTGFTVQVDDDGRAYNPLEAPRPILEADIEDRPIGGLGVHIVRTVMDELEYRRDGGRNILIMRKRMPRDSGSTGEPSPAR